MMDTVDWGKQQNCLRLLRPTWATFYAAWNQSEASKKEIGDQRDLLQDRFGGHDLSDLVLKLEAYLKGDEAGRETPACLELMEQYWQLDVKNTTDMARWTINTPIERACHAARGAMRDYLIAIKTRHNKSREKEHKTAEKAAAKAAKAATKPGTGKTLAEMRGMLEADD